MGETGSAVAVENPRFAAFFPPDAKLERIAEGFIWAEGPVWFDEIGELRFSDIPNNRMMAWTQEGGLRVFRQPAQSTNGHTRDRDGAMISCEHTGRCVSRTRMDGTYEVLATHWQGKRLNSPNDVVVKSDGSIWFTDPPYGIISDHEGIRAESDIGSNNVYRIDPDTGAVELVADDFDRPNGLAFSVDESVLYVADSGRARGHGFGTDDSRPHHVRALTVVDGRRLGARRPAGRHGGPAVDLGGRRRPLLHAGRRTARPRAGTGGRGQPHFRRAGPLSALHLRNEFDLRHRHHAVRGAAAVMFTFRALVTNTRLRNGADH